ncbi:hypothetical protein KSP39_PZI007493 [Platanthera zijinensis]|uniref:Uncharacterized protein n=1 Tax=Platanthera zijinensis TaxID=2320716 RepID=A0AAP0BPM1_9ASPA
MTSEIGGGGSKTFVLYIPTLLLDRLVISLLPKKIDEPTRSHKSKRPPRTISTDSSQDSDDLPGRLLTNSLQEFDLPSGFLAEGLQEKNIKKKNRWIKENCAPSKIYFYTLDDRIASFESSRVPPCHQEKKISFIPL